MVNTTTISTTTLTATVRRRGQQQPPLVPLEPEPFLPRTGAERSRPSSPRKGAGSGKTPSTLGAPRPKAEGFARSGAGKDWGPAAVYLAKKRTER